MNFFSVRRAIGVAEIVPTYPSMANGSEEIVDEVVDEVVDVFIPFKYAIGIHLWCLSRDTSEW